MTDGYIGLRRRPVRMTVIDVYVLWRVFGRPTETPRKRYIFLFDYSTGLYGNC